MVFFHVLVLIVGSNVFQFFLIASIGSGLYIEKSGRGGVHVFQFFLIASLMKRSDIAFFPFSGCRIIVFQFFLIASLPKLV